MLLPSSQTTGDLHLSWIIKIADVISALLLYLHSYKKLQEVEKKGRIFTHMGITKWFMEFHIST